MKIASSIIVAALLVASTGNAQTVDISRMSCKELTELPKETVARLMIWLDGYLTDDEEPRVVDFEKMKVKAEKLGLYCMQNPKVSILSAAEDVMEK